MQPTPDQLSDQASFETLTQPYRYELLVHCYRLLGSIEDAEDALQNTYLRAWQHLDQLEDIAKVRAWLYKIATNISLDLLKSDKTRSLPHLIHAAADPADALGWYDDEHSWLDPLPDFYLARYRHSLEQQYETLEHVTLAFLVVLQQLPGRQRAILLLCDVLDWKAAEAADALGMTVTAVNSALQRARATLRRFHSEMARDESITDQEDPDTANLLAQYVKAWESADITGLMDLIHTDARLTMPPLPVWYHGLENIRNILGRVVFDDKRPGDFRLHPTRSNGRPAFLVYQRGPNDGFQPVALHILTLQYNKIVQIDDFLAMDQTLFSRLNLPVPG